MSKLAVTDFKSKFSEIRACAVNAVDAAKDISVHPKVNAGLTLTSKRSDKTLLDCKVNVDRKFSLFNLILALVGATAFLFAVSVALKACLRRHDEDEQE